MLVHQAAGSFEIWTDVMPQTAAVLELVRKLSFLGVNEISLVREDLSTSFFRRPAWTDLKGYPSEVCFHEHGNRHIWEGLQ